MMASSAASSPLAAVTPSAASVGLPAVLAAAPGGGGGGGHPGSAPSSGVSSPVLTEQQRAQQQRLQYKQTIVDTWSVKERMVLASAVLSMKGEQVRRGALTPLALLVSFLCVSFQNWVSVSRVMKQYAEVNPEDPVPRPQDWFSQKNCALQYNKLQDELVGGTGTPRRKRGGGGGGDDHSSAETPEKKILRVMKAHRLKELEKTLADRERRIHECQVGLRGAFLKLLTCEK